MAKKGHRKEEILWVLREVELVAKVVEICRKHGSASRAFTCGRGRMRVWSERTA